LLRCFQDFPDRGHTRIIDLAPQCKVKSDRRILPGNVTETGAPGTKRGIKQTTKMASRYTVSQLARAAGVPTSTLRYYERAGLLNPEHRSAGNYRLYTDASLDRVQFIRAAQSVGFTLDDVKALLSAGAAADPSCGDVQILIKERLKDIDQRLRDLKHVQRVLKSALRKCIAEERAGRCYMIETLRSGKPYRSARQSRPRRRSK
jgi:MerR family mercuric resistance operon transcriptional regulator